MNKVKGFSLKKVFKREIKKQKDYEALCNTKKVKIRLKNGFTLEIDNAKVKSDNDELIIEQN